MFRLLILSLVVNLFSCQDEEKRQNADVDIVPTEEKKDELNDKNRPMLRSFLLAKMRENEELSSFTEELRKSGLKEEFEGEEGIYTIFAPSNAAYDRIPAKEMNTGDNSVSDESRADLMRYYMVEGEMTVDYLIEKIRASDDGRYEFETALGENLWATLEGDKIVLIDVLGNKASIVTSSMNEYDGVYHIIDHVLQPGEREVDEVEEY